LGLLSLNPAEWFMRDLLERAVCGGFLSKIVNVPLCGLFREGPSNHYCQKNAQLCESLAASFSHRCAFLWQWTTWD
jgi:hypothetical protein